MPTWLTNIWNHPKTTIAGLLIGVVTVAGVLSQQGISLGTAGTGTVVALLSAIATALLGFFAQDPVSTVARPVQTGQKKVLSMALLVVSLGFICLSLSACAAPTWLSDASGVLTLLIGSLGSVASFIAGFSGNAVLAAALATVSAWATKIETGVTDLQELVDQYNNSANPTILGDIEAAAADLQQNLATDFGNLGLPAALLSTIASLAGLMGEQLQAWSSLLPTLSAKAGDKVTLTVPFTKSQYKTKWNAVLSTPTGDPTVDAALAKAKRL